MVPQVVAIAGRTQWAPGAVVDRVRAVPGVPGTEIAGIHEELVSIEVDGVIFVQDPLHARRGGRLRPYRDGERVGVEARSVRDGHVVVDRVEGKRQAALARYPRRTVDQGARIAIPRGVGSNHARAVIEAPIRRQTSREVGRGGG